MVGSQQIHQQIFPNTNKSINKSRWILNQQKKNYPLTPRQGGRITNIPTVYWERVRKLIGLKFQCRLGRDNVMAPGSWTKIMIKSPHWIVHVPWPLLWPLQTPQLLWLPSPREVLQIPGPGVTMVTTESFHTLKSQNLIFFTLSRTSSSEYF